MNTYLPYSEKPSLGERVGNALRTFGMRALTHTGALFGSIALAMVGEPAAAQASGTILAIFAGYLGLVCLLSRGAFSSHDGRIDLGAGVVQTIIAVLLGAPLHGALLLGGAQTFLQRALVSRGSLGVSWLALPFMLIAGLLLLSNYGLSFESVPGALLAGAASFGVVAAATGALRKMLRRTILRPQYMRMLTSGIARLEAGLASKQLPGPLQAQVRMLIGESRQYLQNPPPFDRQAEENIICLDQASQRITQLAARQQPRLWDDQAGASLNAVLRSSNLMRPWITQQAAAQNQPNSLPEAARAQEESADKLLAKVSLLPPELRPYVETIYRSAQNILDTVRERPQVEPTAVQFLNRYLGAAHRVSDEIIRLGRGNALKGEAARNQLARSKDLLARLETAFASEHAFLMQADVINLKAELGVLDSLLKMDGH